MKIEVNISKTYFIILLGAVLLLGVVGIGYAFGGNKPDVMGHSVNEVDWNDQIQGDINVRGSVKLGSFLYVGGQRTILDDGASIWLGDIDGGDGERGLILRAGDNPRIIIDKVGNVGIGKNPSTKLDVSGNIHSDGLIIGDSKPIRYVSGSSPSCVSGIPLLRKWSERTCRGCSTGLGPTSCKTYSGWDGEAPKCTMICENRDAGLLTDTITCVANSWTEAFCIE